MLFFALFLTFGIIFSEALYGASMWWYFGLLLLYIIAFLLDAIFKKSRKSFYIALAFIVGFIAMTAVNLQYNSVSVKDYTGSINAKVGSEIVFNGNYYSFDATDISVDGKTIKYEARVYAYVDEIDFSAGDVVSFYGRLRYYSHEIFAHRIFGKQNIRRSTKFSRQFASAYQANFTPKSRRQNRIDRASVGAG